MDPMFRVDYDDVKRFIEWSFFFEDGAVDCDPNGLRGESTVERCEIELANSLLKIYSRMKKAKKKNTILYHDLSYNDAEIIRSWYYRIPETLLGDKDADTYTRLSVFMVGEERQYLSPHEGQNSR